MRFSFLLICVLAFVACGSGKENDDSTVIAPSQETTICGDFTVPLEDVDELVESAQESGAEAIVEEVESGSLNQGGALRLFKVVIIGCGNDVTTEDNDVVSDDDTSVELGSQE